MTNALSTDVKNQLLSRLDVPKQQLVTMHLDGQLFGLPVGLVQDVLRPLPITPVPLSSPEILGCINLRGRIVTVMDMRRRLGLPPSEESHMTMQVVVNRQNELYSLEVDGVGEVMNLPLDQQEALPANLPQAWRQVGLGVYQLPDRLLLVLNIASLLDFSDEDDDDA